MRTTAAGQHAIGRDPLIADDFVNFVQCAGRND
jgi:hypothetical protein